MEVVDGLPAVLAGIGNDPIARLINTFEFCDPFDRCEDLPQKFIWHVISYMGVMLFGDYQGMHRQLWVDVIKRYDVIVLKDNLCGNLACNQFAE
jgi:hypothetical protein